MLITSTSLSTRRILCAIIAALAVILVSGPPGASANGRATVVSSQEEGPYRIDVSIIPKVAVVGKTHVSVLVRSLESDEIITRATVNLSAAGPANSTDLGPIPAPNDFSPQFYETDLPFDLEGAWEVKVDVSSDLGDASILVPMQVQVGGGSINWILAAAAVVALLAVGIWGWDRITGRKPNSRE